MTSEQMQTIEKFREEYIKNCEAFEDWDSKNVCLFNLYENKDGNDHTLFLMMTLIDKIDDSYAGPMTYTQRYLITPDGAYYEVSSPENADLMFGFMQTLRRIN